MLISIMIYIFPMYIISWCVRNGTYCIKVPRNNYRTNLQNKEGMKFGDFPFNLEPSNRNHSRIDSNNDDNSDRPNFR